MPRLRRTDCSGPGIRRKRHGRGFTYVDEEGRRVDDPEVVERIAELVIPPAWQDVWICPYPNGHLQAIGVDVAGRKQYRYHDEWRRRRDAAKFDEMLEFAGDLPALRSRVADDIGATDDPTRERVLATAVRLIDRGFFRIGSEDYAIQNESYGLATMRKAHVTLLDNDAIVFEYPAKSGKRQYHGLADPSVRDLIGTLKRRRGGGDELLAYRDGRRWRDVKSDDINEYVKETTGALYSAKDFRTWNATALAAVALAVSGEVAGEKARRKKAITRAVKEVAHYLGNTPAVCRASYIDPRVFDRFDAGVTIGNVVDDLGEESAPGEISIHRPRVHAAVVDLIEENHGSAALERVA